MRALRSLGIVMVFVVAALLFAYLAFVHPIGAQFVRGKVNRAVAEAKKIVQEQARPLSAKPTPPPVNTRPPETTTASRRPEAPGARVTDGADLGKPVQPPPPAKVTPVAETKPRTRTLENPFRIEPSELSRSDIDAIIEQRRRIKDKLGEL